MIRVSPPQLRTLADEQDQQARLLAGLLQDIAGPLLISQVSLGDQQAYIGVRMNEILHVVEVLGANHAAVARGLRQAASAYEAVDHPHASGAAKMLM